MRGALSRLLSPILGARPPADLVWITPDIAQSGQFASREASALARLDIGAVLDLRAEGQHEPAPLGKAGLHYLRLPVPDHGAPSEEDLARAADWVLQETGDDRKVLVHCRLGQGRSGTLVVAVLLRMGYPLSDAVALGRGRSRPQAPPGRRAQRRPGIPAAPLRPVVTTVNSWRPER
jgi:protein-tyrosine phosphatase